MNNHLRPHVAARLQAAKSFLEPLVYIDPLVRFQCRDRGLVLLKEQTPFGLVPGNRRGRVAEIVINALRRGDQRAVILSGRTRHLLDKTGRGSAEEIMRLVDDQPDAVITRCPEHLLRSDEAEKHHDAGAKRGELVEGFQLEDDQPVAGVDVASLCQLLAEGTVAAIGLEKREEINAVLMVMICQPVQDIIDAAAATLLAPDIRDSIDKDRVLKLRERFPRGTQRTTKGRQHGQGARCVFAVIGAHRPFIDHGERVEPERGIIKGDVAATQHRAGIDEALALVDHHGGATARMDAADHLLQQYRFTSTCLAADRAVEPAVRDPGCPARRLPAAAGEQQDRGRGEAVALPLAENRCQRQGIAAQHQPCAVLTLHQVKPPAVHAEWQRRGESRQMKAVLAAEQEAVALEEIAKRDFG